MGYSVNHPHIPFSLLVFTNMISQVSIRHMTTQQKTPLPNNVAVQYAHEIKFQ